MHRARGKILVQVPSMAEEESTMNLASGESQIQEEAGTKTSSPVPVHKLRSASVSVPEPSRSRVRDGKIQPYGWGRTRSTSGGSRSSMGSLKSWLIKDVWTKAELYLTDSTLCYEIVGSGLCQFLLEDVLGIQVSQTPPAADSSACEFSVHLYLFSNPQANKKVRVQYTAVFHFNSSQEFVENLKLASQWKTEVLLQTQRTVRDTFASVEGEGDQNLLSSLSLSEEHSVLVSRKFLIFVNPMAGSQRGESDFKQYVKPMLDKAEIQYDVKITKHPNHAREMIKTCNLDKIDGILIASGDGLLYEIINGIMERGDWDKVLKIPFGMLPVGSGNALCSSALLESDEDYRLETAVFQIIRGGVVPMDLATVHLSDGSSTYMTLLGGWGMVADIDIESEKFRKIGKTRFLLGAMASLLKKKIYRGKISYIAADELHKEPTKFTFEHEVPPNSGSPEDSFKSGEGVAVGSDKSSSESPVMPPRQPREGGSSSQEEAPLTENRIQEVEENNSTAVAEGGGANAAPSTSLPSTNLLVPLSEPVPASWTCKEDDFLSFTPLMIPMMSSTFYGDKDLPIGSGNIRLMWVDGNISRRDALNVMTQAEKGSHVELDVVYRVDVKAFRLEPLSPPGIMTVDGEVVSYGPMQAQIHPGLAQVMTRRRRKN